MIWVQECALYAWVGLEASPSVGQDHAADLGFESSLAGGPILRLPVGQKPKHWRKVVWEMFKLIECFYKKKSGVFLYISLPSFLCDEGGGSVAVNLLILETRTTDLVLKKNTLTNMSSILSFFVSVNKKP